MANVRPSRAAAAAAAAAAGENCNWDGFLEAFAGCAFAFAFAIGLTRAGFRSCKLDSAASSCFFQGRTIGGGGELAAAAAPRSYDLCFSICFNYF